MKKLKINIKKGSLALIFLILMLAIMQQTHIVSANTTTITCGPPYYKFFYQAQNPICVPGVPCVLINYAECWNTDDEYDYDVYGARVHIGQNICYRRFVHLGVGINIYVPATRTVNVVADFRILGYLYAEEVGDVTLKININLQRWNGYSFVHVKSWTAIEYFLRWGERMILWSSNNIHFKGPDITLTKGTYRFFFNVYGESMFGWFSQHSRDLYDPGKIYFDSIGYQYEDGGGGGGGGGCPILSIFNGEEYIEEGLLDIHNPDGIDMIHHHTLLTNPVPINNRYYLRLTEHHITISHIDKVELWGELPNGEMKRLYLISAIHSELDQVRTELWFSDDKRVDLLGGDHTNGVSENIDLVFYMPKHANFDKFIFIIEGNNMIIK